jgi:hypothetical protein
VTPITAPRSTIACQREQVAEHRLRRGPPAGADALDARAPAVASLDHDRIARADERAERVVVAELQELDPRGGPALELERRHLPERAAA